MDYLKSASFEHKFWLQVLIDHTQFINDALHYQEERDVTYTDSLQTTLRHLLEEASYLSDSNVIAFTKKVETSAEQLKKIKLSILERQLFGSIRVQLSPSIINQMVHELDEYVFMMSYIKEGKAVPMFHELHYHLLWLRTLSIHANIVRTNLYSVDGKLQKEYELLQEQFKHLYLLAVELTGYLRADVTRFPALEKFNLEVIEVVQQFRNLSQRIDILGTNSSHLPNHITHEIDYYITKLSEATKQK